MIVEVNVQGSVLVRVFERYGGGGGRPKKSRTAWFLQGWMHAP